ncbi:hypothetical protein BC831DRAFT_510461 [Entophlyctis helioformis]|nr:hypothetical protein BC831DRAFT_510461 [Entophlyctis helioformis]
MRHNRTASFEGYDSILARVQTKVRESLAGRVSEKRPPATAATAPLSPSKRQHAQRIQHLHTLQQQQRASSRSSRSPSPLAPAARGATSSRHAAVSHAHGGGGSGAAADSSDTTDDDLGWEFDEDDEAADEELVAFRTDLSPIPENESGIDDVDMADAVVSASPGTIATLEFDVQEPTHLDALHTTDMGNTQSPASLEAEFSRALHASSMLVDIQETFIKRRLATVRELGAEAVPASHDLTMVLMDAVRQQVESVNSAASSNEASVSAGDLVDAEHMQQMQHQHHLDSGVLLDAFQPSASASASDLSSVVALLDQTSIQTSTPSEDVQGGSADNHYAGGMAAVQETPYRLSAQSAAYARFIPTHAPMLSFSFGSADQDTE